MFNIQATVRMAQVLSKQNSWRVKAVQPAAPVVLPGHNNFEINTSGNMLYETSSCSASTAHAPQSMPTSANELYHWQNVI